MRFDRAAQRRGIESVYTSLAGRPLALEFAGTALKSSLTAALALGDEGAEGGRDFTIKLWDTQSTGVTPPPPPGKTLLERGFDRGQTGRLRRMYCAVSGTLQAYDLDQPRAHYWIRDARHVPPWELAAPFRGLLAWWAASWGGVLAHAAVVGRDGKGVLLAGASGAGKSTTALACVRAGMAFLSDDCALVSSAEYPTAHGVYRTAKVDPRLLEGSLSALRAFQTGQGHDRGKTILAFPMRGELLLRQCRIVAVVTQGIGVGQASSLRPVSPARALVALAPSTLLQTPGAGQSTLDLLANVVGSVPCYSLRAGSDFGALAAKLSELIR
jgi:hypothetical protein